MGSIPIPAATAYTPFGKGQTQNTMNTEAIDRIKGYCCEVTQEQWDELVRVADEVGLGVGHFSRAVGVSECNRFACYNHVAVVVGVYSFTQDDKQLIPFPDFLAKLKGEKWQPKAGEMVEVSTDGERWSQREFIAKRNAFFVCWATKESVNTYPFIHCRPLPPTITRTDAERLLNKRIID